MEVFGQAGYDVPMARIHRAIGMGSDQLLDALLPAGRDRDGDGSIEGPAELLASLPRSILGRPR